MTRSRRWGLIVFLALPAALTGCGDGSDDGGETATPMTYSFERDGESTVAYLGQSTRQVLIEDLVGLMKKISADVLGGQNLERFDTPEEVKRRCHRPCRLEWRGFRRMGIGEPGRRCRGQPRRACDPGVALTRVVLDLRRPDFERGDG